MIECARARANNKHSGHKACGPPVWSVTIGVWVTCRVRKLRTRVQREKPLVPMGVGNSTCTWTQHAVAHINDDEVTEGTCIRFLGNGLITESISWIAVLGSSQLKADVAYDKHCSYWCQHDSFTIWVVWVCDWIDCSMMTDWRHESDSAPHRAKSARHYCFDHNLQCGDDDCGPSLFCLHSSTHQVGGGGGGDGGEVANAFSVFKSDYRLVMIVHRLKKMWEKEKEEERDVHSVYIGAPCRPMENRS